MTNAAQDAIA